MYTSKHSTFRVHYVPLALIIKTSPVCNNLQTIHSNHRTLLLHNTLECIAVTRCNIQIYTSPKQSVKHYPEVLISLNVAYMLHKLCCITNKN